MKKYTGIVFIVIVLVAGLVFADLEPLNLNIKNLFNSIVDSNQLKIKTLEMEIKENELEDAEEAARRNNYGGGNVLGIISREKIVKVDPLIAEMNLELSRRAIADEKVTLEKAIYDKSIDYIVANKEITHLETLVSFKQQYINIQTARVKLGLEKQSSLDSMVLDLNTTNLSIAELKLKLVDLQMDINVLLNKPLEDAISLSNDLVLEPYVPFDIDELFSVNLQEDNTVYEKTVLLKAKQVAHDIYKKQMEELEEQEAKNLDPKRPLNERKEEEEILEYKKELNSGMITAELELEIAQLELDDAIRNFEIKLRSSYNNYINNYERYLLVLEEVDYYKSIVEEAKLKLDVGVISTEDLLRAEEKLEEKQFSLLEALSTFNKSKIEMLVYVY